MTTHIEFWLYPQCMGSAVTGMTDLLHIANAMAQAGHTTPRATLFSWSLHSLDGQAVQCSSGLRLNCDGRIGSGPPPDLVLLPGLFVGHGMRAFRDVRQQLQPLHSMLRERHAESCLIAAHCSAVFLLADAGLLQQRKATVPWWLEYQFHQEFPDTTLQVADMLVNDAGLITTGAATAYLQLAHHLIVQFGGVELATQLASTLLIDAQRQSQLPYVQTQQHYPVDNVPEDALIQRAHLWLTRHQKQAFSLTALAQHLAVSERTVIRRFSQLLNTTPGKYAQRLKLEVARRLLEQTDLSLDEIALRIGYQDSSAFRRLFRRSYDCSPSAWRHLANNKA
ncbi:GlxA family transcriptional regulator [Undibacterium rugosum]|uniref:GlxA family transcriptional regulator n=1 Tax=Undibacterium rugosum TaxID=2762291 RepID=UPI001B8201B1|nr:helix-turn-helix domain-containing protein [Undibacterium rugosum]MBR7777677.1 helix-turn-helix domain-containing protein [Undibacterium rugosum]